MDTSSSIVPAFSISLLAMFMPNVIMYPALRKFSVFFVVTAVVFFSPSM